MSSEADMRPGSDRVPLAAAKRQTLGMAHEDWRRLGRVLAWCYLPMLILDSLSIFGISFEAARSLLFIKFLSWLLPIVVAIAFLVTRIGDELSRRRPIPRGLAWRRPPARTRELHYLSRTFVTLVILYIPMHLTASCLVWLGDYLVGKNAEPVIAATEKYFAVHGSLPPNMNALFPDYLSDLPYRYSNVYFSKSLTINGYSQGYWYVSVKLSRGFLQSPRWLVYCSGGSDGIYGARTVPCGPWILCTYD